MKFNIKLTPLVLFLCILAVLVLSIIFGNAIKAAFTPKETFTNFNNPNNTANFGGSVYIPQYSADSNRTVINLYDNLYFDKINGNLIEVEGSACTKGALTARGNTVCGGTAATPTSITSIHITPRSVTNSNNYTTQRMSDGVAVKPYDTYESKATSVDSTIASFTYTTKSPLTDTYQAFYFSANQYTFIHIMNVDSSKTDKGTNVISYVLDTTGILGQPVTYADTTVNVPRFMSTPTSQANLPTSESTMITPEHGYIDSDAKILKISNLIKYDIKNGYILIDTTGTNGQVNYSVFDREDLNRGVISNPGKKLGVTSVQTLKTGILGDGNNSMVLVMAYLKYTLIAIIVPQNAHNYTINKMYMFDENGKLAQSTPTNPPTTTNPPAQDAPPGFPGGSNPCGDDVSCKWYWYFNTIGLGNQMGSHGFLSNDYILKTQVVPPVCPSCPMCPGNGGVCTNCGGKGGSGTKDSSGSSVATKDKQDDDHDPKNVGQFLEDTGSGIGNFARDAGSGVGNFARDAGSGAVGLAKDTVGGAVGLAKDTVGGAVGLTKETVGGAVDLLRDFGSGIANLGKGAATTSGTSSGATSGVAGLRSVSGSNPAAFNGNTPIDYYSHYGALQSKGGNFIPVTADFSKFGR